VTAGAILGAGSVDDRFAPARQVADATLYEGYILYPYRASSAKNRVRWQFGVLVPPAVAEADPSERASCRTECLLRPGSVGQPVVSVRIRFLQVQHRAVEERQGEVFVPVDRLDAGGQVHVEWDEAVEQVVDLPPLGLFPLDTFGFEQALEFPFVEAVETICGDGASAGRVDSASAGRVVRRRRPLRGKVRVDASWAEPSDPSHETVKVAVTVDNTSPWAPRSMDGELGRDEITRNSMVAVHVMMAADCGAFASSIDPPASLAEAARTCDNAGLFPVLIGTDDVVLASPIILYDHPEVAPESPGDLYDSTEIDEILALRVLTLTDEEKAEARATDTRAAAVVDRCDQMPAEMWSRLHGVIRSLRSVPPASPRGPGAAGGAPPTWGPGIVPYGDPDIDPMSDTVFVGAVEISRGSHVILRPSRRADAHDLFLSGLDATVAGVFRDFDGECHVAVSLDDDPATEELRWQGRYLYFHPDELEPSPFPEDAA
jgi:hypothetical protein